MRPHLGWLLEDLRLHQDNLDGRAELLPTLTAGAETALAGLDSLDDLLARLGR